MPLYDAGATRGTVGEPAGWKTTLSTVLDEMRDDTCTISRAAHTRNDMGGSTIVRSNLATGVKCRVSFNADYERTQGARIATDAEYIVALPTGQDIRHDDRIVVDGTGVTFDVADVDDAASHGVEVWAYCRKASTS